jgi:hypothetical protein
LRDTLLTFTPWASLKDFIKDLSDVEIITVDIDVVFSVLIEDMFSHACNGIDPENYTHEVVRQTFITIMETRNEMSQLQCEKLQMTLLALARALLENLNHLNMLYVGCTIFRYQRTLPDGSILLSST